MSTISPSNIREIRFRAWDKGNLQMRTDVVVGKLGSQGYVETHEGNLFEGELMQYTGLKDKNGRDIYEGDIIKNSRGLTGNVSFDGGTFWCTTQYGKYFLNSVVFTMLSENNVEIVGNSYEVGAA